MPEFSSHALASVVLDELLKVVPFGSTVLELGTGEGTKQFCDYYEVISIENDPKWHTCRSELIHVPLVPVTELVLPDAFYRRFSRASFWYDTEILAGALDGLAYDAIIVDGPGGERSRSSMWWFYSRMFNKDVPVIVDDIHRRDSWQIAVNIGRHKGVDGFRAVYGEGDNNMFAVIV